jgi:hypothetical protein
MAAGQSAQDRTGAGPSRSRAKPLDFAWLVRPNAVWRRGRVFFRCAACDRTCTRLYAPLETSGSAAGVAGADVRISDRLQLQGHHLGAERSGAVLRYDAAGGRGAAPGAPKAVPRALGRATAVPSPTLANAREPSWPPCSGRGVAASSSVPGLEAAATRRFAQSTLRPVDKLIRVPYAHLLYRKTIARLDSERRCRNALCTQV